MNPCSSLATLSRSHPESLSWCESNDHQKLRTLSYLIFSTMSLTSMNPPGLLEYPTSAELPPSCSGDIRLTLNRHHVRLRETLLSFFERRLLHYDNRNPHLPLWTDTLCVNMFSEAERSQQVQQMHLIYTRASAVVVWLGAELPWRVECTSGSPAATSTTQTRLKISTRGFTATETLRRSKQ